MLPEQKQGKTSEKKTHNNASFSVNTGIKNHRITAWSGSEGTSVDPPAQPPAEAGSPRAGCTAPCPGGSGISPEKETWSSRERHVLWLDSLKPNENRGTE